FGQALRLQASGLFPARGIAGHGTLYGGPKSQRLVLLLAVQPFSLGQAVLSHGGPAGQDFGKSLLQVEGGNARFPALGLALFLAKVETVLLDPKVPRPESAVPVGGFARLLQCAVRAGGCGCRR